MANYGAYGNTYLSIFKHINDQLTNQGLIVSGNQYGLTLLDAYPTDEDIQKISFRHNAGADDIVLPILTIEQGPITPEAFELGSPLNMGSFRIVMTCFAETNIQRSQIDNAIYQAVVKTHINYYDFDVDFNNPPVSGTLILEDYNTVPANFVGSANPALRWGSDTSFTINKLIE